MGERITTPPHWSDLLETAINLPGRAGETYSRFRTLSLGNQALLMMQSEIVEPQHTYKGWASMDRQVKKGSKAKAIFVPMFRKEEKENGDEDRKLSGFKLVNCMFGVSDTEGEELPEYEPVAWIKERALGALAIEQVAFNLADGNTQGWSRGRTYAINPIAAYPLKTTLHEWAHIEHGHTTPEQLQEYRTHRGIKEGEAETTAYLEMHAIGAEDQFDAAESRNYIQTYLKGNELPETSIKRIFQVTDRIYKAGVADSQET